MDAKYEQALYCQGYLAGYQKALMDYHILPKDSHIPVDIATLPIDQLGLSARAVNCLHAAGCRCIADVCGLDLFRMINYEFCDWIGSFGCEAKIISPPEVAKFFLAVLEDDLDEIKRLYKYDLEPVHLLSGEEYCALTPEQDRLIRPDLNNRVCVVNDEYTMSYVLDDIPNPNV